LLPRALSRVLVISNPCRTLITDCCCAAKSVEPGDAGEGVATAAPAEGRSASGANSGAANEADTPDTDKASGGANDDKGEATPARSRLRLARAITTDSHQSSARCRVGKLRTWSPLNAPCFSSCDATSGRQPAYTSFT
jgi:hypothetical protein